MHRATELREQGHSIREIIELTGLPRATVIRHAKKASNHESLKGVLKHRASPAVASAANKAKWETLKDPLREQAADELQKLLANPKFAVFLGLYWGEGSKSSTTVRVSNNDPQVIRVCYEVLKGFTAKTFTLYMLLYPDHDEAVCTRYWTTLLPGIRIVPGKIHDKRTKKKPGKSPYGLAQLTVNDWELKTRLRVWLAKIACIT